MHPVSIIFLGLGARAKSRFVPWGVLFLSPQSEAGGVLGVLQDAFLYNNIMRLYTQVSLSVCDKQMD